jgi:hypothetical protein
VSLAGVSASTTTLGQDPVADLVHRIPAAQSATFFRPVTPNRVASHSMNEVPQ